MNRLLTIVFALAAVVLGVYAWQQGSEIALLRTQFQQAQSELADLAASQKERAKSGTAESAPAPQPGAQESAIAAIKTAESKPESAKTGGGQPDKPSAMSGMAEMFKSEDGKKMMRSQIAMMTRLQYRDVAKRLGLSPADAEQLMSLLGDRAAAMAGNPFEFMENGKFDEAALAKIDQQQKAARAEYDEKLKAMLGPDRLKALNDYEETLGDRTMVAQFEGQFAAASTPLNDTQRESLVEIMSAERKKLPPSVLDETGRDAMKNFRAMEDEAAMDSYFKQQETYRANVLKRAPEILSPEQVNTLRDSMNQFAEMQKFGIKMSREMFKNSSTGASATPPGAQK